MIELINVNDNKKYYERLNINITMSRMWNTLQTKAETGLGRSEKGYQQIAKMMAGNIARGLGLNHDLAECLTMCYGSFFPSYGNEGKKAVMQFIQDNGMQISEADLARNFIEYNLYRSGSIITPEFDRYLQELFDNSKEPKTPEVKLARLCEKTISSIKKIEMNSQINQTDLFYNVIRDVEEHCINSRELVESPKLQEMLQVIPENTNMLNDEIKEKTYKRLSMFMEDEKDDKINAVYRYIGANER